MKIRNVELETVCGYTSSFPENTLPEIAFAGKSNVGKSSLINVLMNRKNLARVGATPGKTRTVNFYRVDALASRRPAEKKQEQEQSEKKASIPDIPGFVEMEEPPAEFYLVDLPGYGFTNASESEKAKWGQMVERYLASSKALRAVFLLVDIRHEPAANDRQMFEWIRKSGFEPIIIATKSDKLKRSQLQKQMKIVREGLGAQSQTRVYPFSSLSREGRDAIYLQIEELIKIAAV